MQRRLSLFLLVSTLVMNLEAKEHFIYWNSTNKDLRFGGDGESDSLTVRLERGDSLSFICPFGSLEEYALVYQVDEMAFLDCLLPSKHKVVAECTDPSKQLKSTLRTINPFHYEEDYMAGRNYYFISTSRGDKDGIAQKRNGLCTEANMRLRMEVVAPSTTTTNAPQHHTRAHPRSRGISSRTEKPQNTGEDASVPFKIVPNQIAVNLPANIDIDADKVRQVAEWASRGLEGTFRYEVHSDKNGVNPVTGGDRDESNSVAADDESEEISLVASPKHHRTHTEHEDNQLDEGYDGTFIIQEDPARYQASSSTPLLMLSLLVVIAVIGYNE